MLTKTILDEHMYVTCNKMISQNESEMSLFSVQLTGNSFSETEPVLDDTSHGCTDKTRGICLTYFWTLVTKTHTQRNTASDVILESKTKNKFCIIW